MEPRLIFAFTLNSRRLQKSMPPIQSGTGGGQNCEISYTCVYLLKLGSRTWFQHAESGVTLSARRGCCSVFHPGLRMVKSAGTADRMVILLLLFPSREQASELLGGNRERGRKTSRYQHGGSREEREQQQTWELSCQQRSEALHCSEEGRQAFPNPGAPT